MAESDFKICSKRDQGRCDTIRATESMRSVRRAWIRLLRICVYSDLHGTRFLLALGEFFWAITLLMPGNTFDRPTYHVMSWMPEEAWALVFALSGVTQTAILVTGRYHERFPVIFAAWNSVLWWYVVISMYMSVTPPPAAISGELALAIGAAWIWIRSGLEIHGERAGDYGRE